MVCNQQLFLYNLRCMLQHGWCLIKNRAQFGQNSVQKFIKLIRVSSWPFNLWVIAWDHLPCFITNNNVYFQDPVTGPFNFHFAFHKGNSNYVTKPILRFTTLTLEQLISVINHFNIPYFEFLQKNVNETTLQRSNNFFWVPWQHSNIPGRKPKSICASGAFSLIQGHALSNSLADTGAFFLTQISTRDTHKVIQGKTPHTTNHYKVKKLAWTLQLDALPNINAFICDQ